jgi:hypothetical protein
MWNPDGPKEEALVVEIAAARWRKDRAVRSEARQIDLRYGLPHSRPPVTPNESTLDERGCDLVNAIDFLECLDQHGEDDMLESEALVDAVKLLMVVGPKLDESSLTLLEHKTVWTKRQVVQWIAGVAESGGLMTTQLVSTAIAKASSVLRDKRMRKAADEGRERDALFEYGTRLEHLLRYETKFDRDIERSRKLLSDMQQARMEDEAG